MSYKSIYLNRSLPANAGLGTQVWLLKLPRVAADPGNNLLGSLVHMVNDSFLGILEVSYPTPYSLSTPGLVLARMGQVLPQLPAPRTIAGPFVETSTLAGVAVGMDSSSGLDLSATGNFPGLPFALNLDVDLSSTASVNLCFGPGSYLSYIPTDYLSVLSKQFNGDSRQALPSVTVSVPENAIVDQVVIAKNYALQFTQKTSLSTSFGANASAAAATCGGKVAVTQTNDTKFTVAVTDGVEYLVGLQTINWDQL
jgi:hypothetical protein